MTYKLSLFDGIECEEYYMCCLYQHWVGICTYKL